MPRFRRETSVTIMGLLLVGLTSCGGGGGGSSQLSGVATVVFPLENGPVQGSSVVVRGTADGAVDLVVVSGVNASSSDGFRT